MENQIDICFLTFWWYAESRPAGFRGSMEGSIVASSSASLVMRIPVLEDSFFYSRERTVRKEPQTSKLSGSCSRISLFRTLSAQTQWTNGQRYNGLKTAVFLPRSFLGDGEITDEIKSITFWRHMTNANALLS
jgi:hypothetical protein